MREDSTFLKARGAVSVIKNALSAVTGIDYAFIYGSYASKLENEQSDVDAMVIGDIMLEKLMTIIRKPETLLVRDVNPSLYDISELKTRIQERDPFITEVLNGPKIMLIETENELRRTVK